MDKIIEIFDPNTHKNFLLMKDILLILIIFYSVFLNSYMINKNVSKFKANAVFTCIALVSVWQIYDFNPSTYCISNTVWFGAILVTCASGEKLKTRWKFFIYGSVLVIVPLIFLSIYFKAVTRYELTLINIIIFSLTIVACLCVPLVTNNQYVKVSTSLLAITEIVVHVLPEFTRNMDLVWGLSILNLVAYLVFMNSIQKFTNTLS
jgi:hypothetical protein